MTQRPQGFEHDENAKGCEPFWDDRLSTTRNKAVEMALNNFSNDEIAEELELSKASVKVYLSDARRLGIYIPTAKQGRSKMFVTRQCELLLGANMPNAVIRERTGLNQPEISRVRQQMKPAT